MRRKIRDIEPYEFADTATGRPISHCPNEILELARMSVPLRRVEIHTLAKASGLPVISTQRLHQIELSAVAKIKEALATTLADLEDDRPRATKRRRRQ